MIISINNDSITIQETLIIKVLKSTCKKLWCLSSFKKSTSSLTSFTRYCKDIANFLFWKFYSPHQNSLYQFEGNFHAYLNAKNQLYPTFFSRYFKEIANLLFWVIWASQHIKWCFFTFDVYLLAKNRFHPLRFPWDIANLLFWVLWE